MSTYTHRMIGTAFKPDDPTVLYGVGSRTVNWWLSVGQIGLDFWHSGIWEMMK